MKTIIIENGIKPALQVTESTAPMFFHGEVRSYASLDTQQVKDYSKFSMRAFDAEAKYARHDAQFPLDLQEVYKMGEELSR